MKIGKSLTLQNPLPQKNPPPKKLDADFLLTDTELTLAKAARGSKGMSSIERNTAVLEAMFRQYDDDNSGELDCGELRGMFNDCFGMDLTGDEVSAMMKEIDVDGNGLISLGEFKEVAKKSLNTR